MFLQSHVQQSVLTTQGAPFDKNQFKQVKQDLLEEKKSNIQAVISSLVISFAPLPSISRITGIDRKASEQPGWPGGC